MYRQWESNSCFASLQFSSDVRILPRKRSYPLRFSLQPTIILEWYADREGPRVTYIEQRLDSGRVLCCLSDDVSDIRRSCFVGHSFYHLCDLQETRCKSQCIYELKTELCVSQQKQAPSLGSLRCHSPLGSREGVASDAARFRALRLCVAAFTCDSRSANRDHNPFPHLRAYKLCQDVDCSKSDACEHGRWYHRHCMAGASATEA